MEGVTGSEIAGLGVGALLFCATVAAPKVDAFISASQKRSLGLCRRCGDLRVIACSQCKGTGTIEDRGLFSFISPYDPFESAEAKKTSKPCTKCRTKGRFACPECSKQSPTLD